MQPSKRAQLAIFCTVVVDLLGFGIVIPILPLYARNLALHPSPWMTWVNGALNLTDSPFVFWAGVVLVIHPVAQFIAAPILGRLSDLVGRRPVLWVSLMGTCAAYLIMAMTGRFEWVLVARVLDGITGGNISVAQAAMADSSSPKERSKALGIIGAAFGLGFVLGPALAGILAGSHLGKTMLQNYGWQLPFFVAAGMSLTASMLVLFFLPETLRPEAKVHARKVQSRGHALIRELKRPGMAQILLITFLAMSGFAMMEGTYALLCAKRFNFSQRGVGYLFAFVGVLIVIYQGGLVRVVAKRIPERIALFSGLALMACSLPLIPYAPWEAPFLLVMIPLCWGSGMNQTATSALASQLTPPDEQGGLFGVITSMSTVGRIVGPLVGTFVFAKFGYAAPYWLASAFLVLGLVLAITLLRPPAQVPDEDPI
jgi:MFS transporter, DHA1 family, tetracycline resistance protein